MKISQALVLSKAVNKIFAVMVDQLLILSISEETKFRFVFAFGRLEKA